MNHLGRIILAVLWIILAIFLCIVLVNGLDGRFFSNTPFSFPLIFSVDGGGFISRKVSDNDILNNLDSSSVSFNVYDVAEIEVDLIAESIEFISWAGDEIEVNVSSNLVESLRPSVYLDKKTLKIDQRVKKLFWGNKPASSAVVVKIPESLLSSATAIKTIDVETISGRISINNLFFNNADISSISGNIILESFGSNDFDCETVSGKIEVYFSDDIPLESEFQTVSGNILIALPENTGFTLRCNSVSGDVTNEFTGVYGARKVSDVYKQGYFKIDTESISGDVLIKNISK